MNKNRTSNNGTSLKKPILLTIAVVASIAVILAAGGCASQNPNYDPHVTASATNPQYVVDPRLNAASNTVSQVAGTLAPMNPYAGITDMLIKFGFGLGGAISGGLVAYKNRQAVIGTLADGVVKANAGPAILDHASNTEHYTAIADAINQSSGANQKPTGSPS